MWVVYLLFWGFYLLFFLCAFAFKAFLIISNNHKIIEPFNHSPWFSYSSTNYPFELRLVWMYSCLNGYFPCHSSLIWRSFTLLDCSVSHSQTLTLDSVVWSRNWINWPSEFGNLISMKAKCKVYYLR